MTRINLIGKGVPPTVVRHPPASTIGLSRRSVASFFPGSLSSPSICFARITTAPPDPFAARLEKLTEGFSREDRAKIIKAYRWVKANFAGQTRRSGAPVLEHFVSVAEIIRFKFRLNDPKLIAAALVHDLVEDIPDITIAGVRRELGDEVATLVDGETKLSKELAGEARTRESFKKWIAAMRRDIRIAVLKFADCLDNMKDQQVFPPAKVKEHILDALMVYAGLAKTLGMWEVRLELEDLSLAALKYAEPDFVRERGYAPDFYDKTFPLYRRTRYRSARFVDRTVDAIAANLALSNIKASVLHTPRSFSDVLGEIPETGMSLQELVRINPLFLDRIVVVVEKEADIQKAAATFVDHQGLPTYDKMKNTFPRDPLAYHAAELDVPLEEQGTQRIIILTRQMLARNRHGILFDLQRGISRQALAAYWPRALNRYLGRALISSDLEMREAIASFASTLTAYTPRRRSVKLAYGATMLDFAFMVDSGVGLRARQALLRQRDGSYRHASLVDPVEEGAIIRIVTARNVRAHPAWLSHVRMPPALEAIRGHLRSLPAAKQIRLAREAMDLFSKKFYTNWAAVARVSFMPEFIAAFREKFQLAAVRSADDLIRLMGRGELDPNVVGNEFNRFYSDRIRQRRQTGNFRMLQIDLRINHDRPGIIKALSEKLAQLRINVREAHFVANDVGSAAISLKLPVLSSLQEVQVRTIVRQFLTEVGGERITH